MAYFAKRAGNLDLLALPNKNGASGVIQDMLRGDVQAAFLNVASSGSLVEGGNCDRSRLSIVRACRNSLTFRQCRRSAIPT
jgi:tripartite-type tricarboxylate transporter receptor subunit TctC